MSEMSPRQRLLTALRGGRPDRVPCSPHIIRWIRHHWGCTCPDHQAKLAGDFGLDLLIQYGAYTWQSVSNDYVYAPGGGYSFNACALYGDVILREVKQQYGRRVALVGGLDPVYTFDMGTPDAVRRAVRQAICDAAEGGGYILGTAEAIAPETPAESLRAASEAARQFGVYR